jgi:hypothetical protein
MESGGYQPLAEAERAAILAENDRMGAAGLRVLGMAFAERRPWTRTTMTGFAGSAWPGLPIRFGRTSGS